MRRTRLMRAAVAICPGLILATCTAREDCAAGNPLMPICFDPRPPEPQVVFMKAWDSTWTRSDIYTMNSDGTNERRLTTDGMRNPTLSPGRVEWSPDGQQIVFSRRSDTTLVRSQIYVMRADGTDLRNLSNQATAFDGNASWSPDGRRIVFSSDRHNPTKTQSCCVTSIYVMDADGSSVQRLTTNWNDNWPRWSPDGKTIAFHSTRSGVSQIFLMNADGSNVRQLTTGGYSRQPSWSPDGLRIAFEGSRDPATGGMGNGIYVMNADGSDQMIVGQGLAAFMRPAWSSDGRQVFFCGMTVMNGPMHVYAVPMEGGALRDVSDKGSDDCCPDFKQPRSPGRVR